MRSRRAEWQKRVAEWRRSGLTAAQYAESVGVKAETLRHWSWRLKSERTARAAGSTAKAKSAPAASSLVEVLSSAAVDSRLELELGGGRRVLVPNGFDADELGRLVAVLERLEVAPAAVGSER